MDCGQIQKRMPSYVDGMDSPEERRLIDQHLPSCPSCRKALEEYQKDRERLRGLEEVEPPPGFAPRIMAQIEEEEKKGGILKKLFFPLHVKIPIQAVGAIVIAVLAIQVYHSSEPQKAAIQRYEVTVPAAPPKEEIGKEAKQEDAISPAAKSPQADVLRAEEPKKKAASSPIPETAPQAPATAGLGAASSREPQRAEAPVAQKRAKMQMESPSPSQKLEAVLPRAAETITLTLKANDIAAAERTVEAVLRNLGGTKIEKSPSGDGEVVTADLPARNINDLLERLRPFVEAKERDRASQTAEGTVLLRIEIRPK